eukprot:2796706-Amphidinium_carterae.1
MSVIEGNDLENEGLLPLQARMMGCLWWHAVIETWIVGGPCRIPVRIAVPGQVMNTFTSLQLNML